MLVAGKERRVRDWGVYELIRRSRVAEGFFWGYFPGLVVVKDYCCDVLAAGWVFVRIFGFVKYGALFAVITGLSSYATLEDDDA